MSEFSLGYQVTQNNFEIPPVNNAGDPFTMKPGYLLNSFTEEKELVEYYGYEILQFKENIWGYCASGSTESILNGLWMARKRFPEATIYASKDCHFSVPKIADMLRIRIVLIDTVESDGRMDMTKLHNEIANSSCDTAIVVLTMGTTIRNAYDNISEFYKLKLNDVKYHLHVDGAFGGAIYPFLKKDWLNLPIDTFNVSFHKFFGCPFPCSLFITTKRIQNEIQGKGCFGKDMVCLPDKDYTISCSRNGTAVLKMHQRIIESPNFLTTHINDIVKCLQHKTYLMERLNGVVQYRTSSDIGLSVELLNLSLEIKPLLFKYGVNIRHNGKGFDTHVYICAHVTQALIDQLVSDLCYFNQSSDPTDFH